MWCIIFIALMLSILGITLTLPCDIILLTYCWIQFASILLRIFASMFIKDQFSSVAQSWTTLCDPMNCSTLGFPVHHQFPKLTQTHVHWVGDAIQPSHPLSSPSPPAFNLSQHQGLFKWVSSSHQVPKVLEFQLQHSPSNKYSGLISFRMDWLDLLAVQGTLKSHLQHHSSKASIFQRSALTLLSTHDHWKNHSIN